jgi:MFS family permease
MPEGARRPGSASLWVAGALLVLLFASNLPTALYGVYQQRYGFDDIVLTLIFASYALALIPALLLFGQLSDAVGRRPVMLAGLALAAGSLALFAFADGVAWLFAARILQGIAVGSMSAAATAALVEVEPGRDHRRAAFRASLTQTGGSAAAPLVAGMLAEWLLLPLRLCFLVGITFAVASAAGVLRMREPLEQRRRWRIQRPRVPTEIRIEFARAGLTGATIWGAAALFFSVVPSYTSEVLGTRNLALLGGVAAIMLAVSCLGQWWSSRLRSARSQPLGLVVLAVGLVALAIALPLHALAMVLASAVLAGAGHGLALLGAQADINRMAPPRRRGELTAAFYVCIYLGVALSVISVGVVAEVSSLTVAVAWVTPVLALIGLGTAAWHVLGPRRARRRGTRLGERSDRRSEAA